eukprot:scaffold83744_cov33-Tisochrysis_lutea.AAC.1
MEQPFNVCYAPGSKELNSTKSHYVLRVTCIPLATQSGPLARSHAKLGGFAATASGAVERRVHRRQRRISPSRLRTSVRDGGTFPKHSSPGCRRQGFSQRGEKLARCSLYLV